MRIISWNLLRLTGAGGKDVAAIIESHRPDLVFLQEATRDIAELPTLIGGYFYRHPMEGRVYGLAAWSREALRPPYALKLPASQVPGRVPPRIAQIVRLGEVTFANVHLSHGQFLNRWQLFHIANAVDGPTAIVGDYNAVGPITLPGFEDVGPRQPTHSPTNIISLRLDRCMARGMGCSHAQVLARGPSDHHPIILNLHLLTAATACNAGSLDPARRSSARSSFGKWLQKVPQTPNGIRVPHVLRRAIDRKLGRRKLVAISSRLSADVTRSRSQPQGLDHSASLDVG